MKYIIFTFEGTGFPLAKHLIDEGFEVIVGHVADNTKILTRKEKAEDNLEDPDEKRIRLLEYKHIVSRMPADVLVEKLMLIKNPEEYFVFFDSNNLFYYANRIRHLGFHGNFPTEEDRLFEIDRNFAKEFVTTHYPKLKITEKKSFRNVNAAKRFLNQSDKVWVLKSQTDSIQAYVPNTNDPEIACRQLIENLTIFKDFYESAGFFLEVKIPSILEYTPEKIYYDGVPLALTMNIENKFIGSGNISFQVGCAGDLVFPISMDSKIHDIAFPPIVDTLAKQHKGLFIWDASILIDKSNDDIYFGEFCPNRPGYNSFYTELSQVPSVHSFFESVIHRKNPYQMGTVGASLMLFNLMRDPKTEKVLGDLSISYPRENDKHLWPYDIYKKNSGDSIRTTGYDIHLSPVTASGTSLHQAVDRLYKIIDSIQMAGLYYRPKFDYLSTFYSTSIINRMSYGLAQGLFELPFQRTF